MKTFCYLPQGFEEYEASVFTDVFGWSRHVGDIPVKVVTAGRRPESSVPGILRSFRNYRSNR